LTGWGKLDIDISKFRYIKKTSHHFTGGMFFADYLRRLVVRRFAVFLAAFRFGAAFLFAVFLAAFFFAMVRKNYF